MKTGRRVNEADGPATFDLDLSEQGSNGDGEKARVIFYFTGRGHYP
jgi:hypothetical protein